MSDVLKTAIPFLLVAALSWAVGVWTDKSCFHAKEGRDTVTVTHVIAGPNVTVSPNPIPAQISHLSPVDSLRWARRADSLLEANQDKDRLIKRLTLPQEAQSELSATSPDGIAITGVLYLQYDPLDEKFTANIKLDSIRVASDIITIRQTEIQEVTHVDYIIAATLIGLAAGAWLIHK